MSSTSVEAADSSVMTPIPSQAPPAIVITTQSMVMSAVLGGGSAVEPQVMPTYLNTSLVFSFEGAFVMGNILEESQQSEKVPAGTSVVAADEVITLVIDHSSIGILLQTLAPHLTRLLSPPSAPQPPSVMPSTAVASAPSLPLAYSDGLMEDFLQHFTSGLH